MDTILDKVSSCKELLTLSNLVEFGLVYEEKKMSRSILARLKKRSNTFDTPTSSSAPLKKPRVDYTTSPIRILLYHSNGGNMVDKKFFKRLCCLCSC